MKSRDYTLRYALRMFLAISGFFILMDFLGLSHHSELRVANILFILYFSNRLALSNSIEFENAGYLHHLSSLFVANVVNVVLCILGFVLFVEVIRPDYLSHVKSTVTWGRMDKLLEACIMLFLEGMAGASIVSFALMQYWKDRKRVRRTV